MVVFEWAYAARILLPMEASSHLAPRGLGHPDSACLFFDPRCSNPNRAQKTRFPLQLDVRLFWRIYRGLRCNASDGCVDSVGSFVLVFGRRQSDYGDSLRANGGIPGTSYAPGGEPPQSGGSEGCQ